MGFKVKFIFNQSECGCLCDKIDIVQAINMHEWHTGAHIDVAPGADDYYKNRETVGGTPAPAYTDKARKAKDYSEMNGAFIDSPAAGTDREEVSLEACAWCVKDGKRVKLLGCTRYSWNPQTEKIYGTGPDRKRENPAGDMGDLFKKALDTWNGQGGVSANP